jgi:Cu(I)/Ag(I) efflux system membrane fusion protein
MKRAMLALLLAACLPGGDAWPAGEDAPRAPIRLDAAQRQRIGLTFGMVERRPVDKHIETVGRLDYDERKLAEVTLRVGGYIEELFADFTGKPVRRGDPLFSLYSPDLLTAQREYLLARDTVERLGRSQVPEAREGAAALLRASRERLRLWELTDQQVRELEGTKQAKVSLTIHSPVSGVVVEKHALRGQAVQPGMTLYRIADLSTIWIYADVYEQDAGFVRVGQEAEIRLPYEPSRRFAAHVSWVYPTVDAKARTVKVRFELPNSPEQSLRPEMYANVRLTIPLGERLVVPATALLDSGRRQVAFIDGGEGLLVPREVETGGRFDDWTEVTAGLAPGERVVTSANFLVDSESKLQAAESMMAMMGALGMGHATMEGARGMEMAGGESAGPEEKVVGDLRVAVFPAREAATVGENVLRVRVRDATGAPVRGARVSFTYTMDMPGMAIGEAQAREVGDGLYEGVARFTMGGPWTVVVQIERPGAPPVREKFTVRVHP